MYARLKTGSEDALGNFGMKLATFLTWCNQTGHKPLVDDAFFKYGRQLAIRPTIPSAPDGPGVVVPGQCNINSFFHFNPENVKNIQQIIKPTKELEARIDIAYAEVKKCKAAFHIRRGLSAPDSVHLGFLPFASQEAVDAMIKEAKKIKGKVYVASDSPMTKEYVKKQLGEDKVVMFDWTPGFTADEHSQKVKVKDEDVDKKLNSYVEWFLLSKCPTVYITAGGVQGRNVPHGTEEGITSTFGYSAAIYGGKIPIYVFNDGEMFLPFPMAHPNNPKYCWSDLPLHVD